MLLVWFKFKMFGEILQSISVNFMAVENVKYCDTYKVTVKFV